VSHEPRAVARPPGVSQTSWYCLDCGEVQISEHLIQRHWIAQHGLLSEIEPVALNGINYAIGSQLLLMQHRRDRWIEERAAEFASQLHDGFGADDLIAEAEIRGGEGSFTHEVPDA
jgi:hypothetical protein